MPFHEKFYSASLPDMENIDFLSVLDQLDDGVIIADADGIILFYNAAQSKIDGLKPEDALGRKVTDIYELNNRTSIIMQVIYQHASIKNRAFFYRSCSGKVANTITSAYPLSKNGRINGVICFVKDYELLYRSTPMSCATDCRPDLGNGTQYTFADLIGTGPDFQTVVGTARKAAVSTSPVMIQGETGTGKELFAQAIHNHSPRRNSRYVAVNCAAIPHDLLEGMLFGTVRGAFTGAMDKPGLFETAHGGTLFLDELLSMPVELQAKLLRVLQEKRVQRLGAVKEIPVDVRIISSISQDPRSAIREKKLRTDLFYRLGVVMVKLPPLRHRRESMNELISHFIDKYNTRLGTHVRYISQEVLDLFLAYKWPGNVRELAHLIEGAMNMAGQEETIGIKHFSPGLDCLEPVDFTCRDQKDHDSGEFYNTHTRNTEANTVNINLAKAQNDNEKNAVRTALAACSGNVTKAAETLGISRQLLHYKIKKHGFSRKEFMP
jgi:arginine utilization regulatory protein